MSKFDRHFHLQEQNVVDYVKSKHIYFSSKDELKCSEIGDGNINYVFRVENVDTGESVVIKHADATTRVTHKPISPTHNRIESEALRLQAHIAPGFVPVLYRYDPVMCCLFMEDLKDYEIVRNRLCEHKICKNMAEQVTDFMSSLLMRTTDNIISTENKRRYAEMYTNPEQCEITERLVYTEPYTNTYKSNVLYEPNKEFVEKELYHDDNLHLEVADLKTEFKSNNQSLIHGDLHTQSMMYNDGKFKFIDAEFATYGPAGYDVGNVLGNLLLAWANYKVTKDNNENVEYEKWLDKTIIDVVDLFYKKSYEILLEESTDRMSKVPGFIEKYLKKILEDSAGVCGLEAIRRTVGMAKAKDIEMITDTKQRILLERIIIYASKDLILNRHNKFHHGEEYITVFNNAYNKAIKSIEGVKYE